MLKGGNKLTHTLTRRVVLSVDTDIWVEELSIDYDNLFQLDLID